MSRYKVIGKEIVFDKTFDIINNSNNSNFKSKNHGKYFKYYFVRAPVVTKRFSIRLYSAEYKSQNSLLCVVVICALIAIIE